MKKKTIRGILAILGGVVLVFVLIIITFGNSGNKKLTELMATSDEIQKIKAARMLVQDNLLDDIKFDQFSLAYDSKNNRWFYSLVKGSDTASNPFVTLKAEKGAKVLFEECKVDEEWISLNKSIHFIVYTDESYFESEIVCTTLPLMEISVTDSNYGIEVNTRADENESENPLGLSDAGEPIKFADTDIHIKLFDNQANLADSSRITQSSAKAHIRGNSSVIDKKKSYKLSLRKESIGNNIRKNDVSLLGMRADDDWVLYGASTEGERLRNVFSTNLWMKSCGKNNPYGINNGCEGKYVEVLMNGEYWGLYALMYPMDTLQLGIKDTGNAETSDHYYRTGGDYEVGQYFAEPVLFENVYTFDYRGAAKELNSSVQLQPLLDFHNLLKADDEIFLSEYENYVYLENAMDMWLYVKLVLASDNVGPKNVNYIAKYDADRQEYVMLFSPWDMDRTWGYMYVKGQEEYKDGLDMYCLGISRMLALDTDRMIELLQKRYRELRDTSWSIDEIFGVLGPLVTDIWGSGAMYREAEKWPTEDVWQTVDDINAERFIESIPIQLYDMDTFMNEQQLREYADKMKKHYGVGKENVEW